LKYVNITSTLGGHPYIKLLFRIFFFITTTSINFRCYEVSGLLYIINSFSICYRFFKLLEHLRWSSLASWPSLCSLSSLHQLIIKLTVKILIWWSISSSWKAPGSPWAQLPRRKGIPLPGCVPQRWLSHWTLCWSEMSMFP